MSESAGRSTLDVLVPTRNRPAELAVTIAGLAGQDHPFNLLVSDQSDGAPSYAAPTGAAMLSVLASRGHRVETRRNLPRRGLAEHRAALLDRSRARYVLFCDDDVWLEPGPVARLHEAIVALRCGVVVAAVQELSYVDDHRPHELAPFEAPLSE